MTKSSVSILSTLFDQEKVWERYINRIAQEQYELGFQKGLEEARMEGVQRKTARALLRMKFAHEQIAEITMLPLAEVETLAREGLQ